MLAPLFLAATSAAGASDADRVVIDLTVPAPCAGEEYRIQTEIVVCAKREDGEANRLTDARTSDPEALPRAAVQLADGTELSAETESADLGMARSQRLMVRLKLKF